MEYPLSLFYKDGDETPAAIVQNEAEHNAQLIGWGQPPLYTQDEKVTLQAECDAKGIEYDKRWGVSRLKSAIEEAE